MTRDDKRKQAKTKGGMGRAFGINTGRLPAMGWGMGRWMGNSGVAQSKMVSLRHSQNTTSVAGNMELSPATPPPVRSCRTWRG